MKPIPCKLYVFADDVDAVTASPNDAKEEIEMRSISACYRYVKENGIKQFIIWELYSR